MSTLRRYPPPVPVRTRPRPSLIHWPIVATASAGAVVFMAGTLVAAWFANRTATVPKERPTAAVQEAAVPEEPTVIAPAEDPAVAPRAEGTEMQPAVATEQANPPEPEPLPAPSPPACESFGTRVQFVSNPTDAARLARQDNKLLFVLHISGNFEDDKFT